MKNFNSKTYALITLATFFMAIAFTFIAMDSIINREAPVWFAMPFVFAAWAVPSFLAVAYPYQGAK
jgi:hypothetical protein